MAGAVSFEDGIGRKEIYLLRRRVLALSADRLRRIDNELKPQQRRFLTLLPLLFHINHPMLPGFAGSDTPAGLPDYKPDRRTLLAARALARSFEYKKRALQRIPIHALYLMGSIGSIGQTSHSDMDIWLCHDPEMEAEPLALLQEKARLLELWGRDVGLEVHFFLMSADRFREGGASDALSHDSSGSTQHRLLLEEFYRTAVLLAGRLPLWWLVPPDREQDYDDYARKLLDQRFVDPGEWLDFGGLDRIRPHEFFGAAHWQLFKGIDAPYKAVLKILLMEAYAAEYPQVQWSCLETKHALYRGLSGIDEVDPYLLLYRKVETYLQERGEKERLELARRCFYFKTEEHLSHSLMRRDNWKRDRLSALAESWNWDMTHLRLLDTRDRWKLDQVLKERNRLVQELSRSYRGLMSFARNHAATGGIDPSELNLLGRKLYAALERRPGKVEHINPGISRDLSEPRLSLYYEVGEESPQRWTLYRGELPDEETHNPPLRVAASLVELLAWCLVNKVADQGTQFALAPPGCPVSTAELTRLLDLIRRNLPSTLDSYTPMDRLQDRPHAEVSVAFANVGVDPLDPFSQSGLHLTSDRSDPLSYGGRHHNLVHRLEHLVINSWGEVEVFLHQDTEGLLECLVHHLQLSQPDVQLGATAPLQVYGFGSPRSNLIARRLGRVAEDLSDCFSPLGDGPLGRYLLGADNRYFLIWCNEERYQWLQLDSEEEVFDALGEPRAEFRSLRVDEQTLPDLPLPIIYAQNLRGVIQVFYQRQRSGMQLYLLDEQGSLFRQTIAGAKEKHLVVQQKRFLDSLYQRRSLLSPENAEELLLQEPDFFRLTLRDDGSWGLRNIRVPADEPPDTYMTLELVCGQQPPPAGGYTLICDNHDFDSMLLGDQLHRAVAEYVLSKRQSGEPYPVYLTSVSLAGLEDEDHWHTAYIFGFKKRLEERINEALQTVAAERRRR